MASPDMIVCRPTPWFLYRSAAVFLMFGVFAVLFYIDGSTGYRKKNEVFFLHKAFQQAGNDFAAMNSGQSLGEAEWKLHAEKQSVRFATGPGDAPDPSILPAGLPIPMPWPEILHDYSKMKSQQWNQLWLEYSAQRGFPEIPAEQAYDKRKIDEQWVVFWICSVLALTSLFFLLRTLRRSIKADGEALTAADGRRIAYSDLRQLDLRKWDTKGIAYAHYEGASGSGKVRIDGLTYGGFRKDQGEPAEQLMRLLRSKFSGEILEYALADDDNDASPEQTA